MVKRRKLRPEVKANKPFAEHIRAIFNESFRTLYNPRQIARRIGAKNEMQRREVVALLDNLVQEGFLLQESPGRYRRNPADLFLSGTFVRNHNRLSITPDNGGETISVSESNAQHALSGDRVEYMPINHGKYKGEAEVTDIIERRAAQQIVGTVEKIGPKETRLRVDSRAFDSHVDIPAAQALGAKEGEKVVARLTDWPIHSDSPVGEVIEILGQSGENNTEMHAILAEFGLPTRYPEELEKIADAIDEKITDEEIARREDFRQVTTFTIDPADAKDFDDALSLRRTPEGEWEVGVHIADVNPLRQGGKPHRPRSLPAGHVGIPGRPHRTHAARAAVQPHLLPAAAGREALLLGHLHPRRECPRKKIAHRPHGHSLRPPLRLRRGTRGHRDRPWRPVPKRYSPSTVWPQPCGNSDLPTDPSTSTDRR